MKIIINNYQLNDNECNIIDLIRNNTFVHTNTIYKCDKISHIQLLVYMPSRREIVDISRFVAKLLKYELTENEKCIIMNCDYEDPALGLVQELGKLISCGLLDNKEIY